MRVLVIFLCLVFASSVGAQPYTRKAKKYVPPPPTNPIFVKDVGDCVLKTRGLSPLTWDDCNQMTAKKGIYIMYVIQSGRNRWVQTNVEIDFD